MLLILQHQRSDGETDHYHLKPGRCFRIGRGSACEIRILDLNLSRNHGTLEFIQEAWRFTETGSTNGVRINGDVMDGSITVTPGMTLEMGSTTLVVSRIFDPVQDPHGGADLSLAKATGSSAARRAITAQPQPQPETSQVGSVKTAVLTPGKPAEPAPAAANPTSSGTSFFVTVLGVRIGPLTKAQARDLKDRELRGELEPMDLNGYPRPDDQPKPTAG